MKRFIPAILIAASTACIAAAPLNDLYFGYDMMRHSEVYLILAPDQRYPDGAKLNGAWSRPFSSSFAGTRVTSPTWITFRPDGAFSRQSVIGVDNANGRFDSSSSKTTGMYSIKGLDLMLTENGKRERHSVFQVAGGQLNIDGLVYTRNK